MREVAPCANADDVAPMSAARKKTGTEKKVFIVPPDFMRTSGKEENRDRPCFRLESKGVEQKLRFLQHLRGFSHAPARQCGLTKTDRSDASDNDSISGSGRKLSLDGLPLMQMIPKHISSNKNYGESK